MLLSVGDLCCLSISLTQRTVPSKGVGLGRWLPHPWVGSRTGCGRVPQMPLSKRHFGSKHSSRQPLVDSVPSENKELAALHFPGGIKLDRPPEGHPPHADRVQYSR